MIEEVLAFERDLVSGLSTDQFSKDTSVLADIMNVAIFRNRDSIESDLSFKQIIPYSIFRYENLVLTYKRSGWSDESRLHQKNSIGVGGHINRSDDLGLLKDVSPILEWARDREVREEFDFEAEGAPALIGCINDDSNEVGRVHFGVVYEFWLSNPRVEAREKRVHLQISMLSIDRLIQTASEFENWSRILINEYLSQ